MSSETRIVFKVGARSLTGAVGGLSAGKLLGIVRQLAVLHAAGHELVLVSSGAVSELVPTLKTMRFLDAIFDSPVFFSFPAACAAACVIPQAV